MEVASKLDVCGVLDPSISPVLLAWVKQGTRMVCGIIGPGTSRTLTSKWDSPLENSNVGSQGAVETAANLVQSKTGVTSVTQFSSTQVWQGNMPLKTTLNLIFIAQSDSAKEVMLPLQWLEEFASPELNQLLPGGRIPGAVTINIGRKIIVANCVIENIPVPIDKEKDNAGNLIRAEVNLDIQTKVMLSKQSQYKDKEEVISGISDTWKTEAW